MPNFPPTIVRCDYINPVHDKSCNLMRDGALVFQKGVFVDKGPFSEISVKFPQAKLIDRSGFLALPGFFDMHFHWVQDDVRLKPKASLLKWLENYTWPYEARFKSKVYSKNRAQAFARELLACGTIGGGCYASIHGHTVEDAIKYFQGHYVIGNVLMTMNSPDYLCQSKKDAISLCRALSAKYKNSFAVTPRFALTTHPDVMKKCGEFARKNKSFIQSHLSETKNEIKTVLEIYREMEGFEKVKSYTEVYKKSGILGKRTIMGHGIHLSPEELKTLKNTGTALAHCPTSNAPVRQKGLGSGLFDFQKVEKYKIPWALGSDIGGGPFLSMFDVMNSFVGQNQKVGIRQATFTKALYRATLAGAEILNIEKKAGSLDQKKEANFILVQAPKKLKNENAEGVLRRLCGRPKKRPDCDSLVYETYIKGNPVYAKS